METKYLREIAKRTDTLGEIAFAKADLINAGGLAFLATLLETCADKIDELYATVSELSAKLSNEQYESDVRGIIENIAKQLDIVLCTQNGWQWPNGPWKHPDGIGSAISCAIQKLARERDDSIAAYNRMAEKLEESREHAAVLERARISVIDENTSLKEQLATKVKFTDEEIEILDTARRHLLVAGIGRRLGPQEQMVALETAGKMTAYFPTHDPEKEPRFAPGHD